MVAAKVAEEARRAQRLLEELARNLREMDVAAPSA
jgi:hypothetical protein